MTKIEVNDDGGITVFHNGFIIDFFGADDCLGMTVEVGEGITPEAPYVDIFVDKYLKINVIEAK